MEKTRSYPFVLRVSFFEVYPLPSAKTWIYTKFFESESLILHSHTKGFPVEMIDTRLAFPALRRRGCFQTKGHSAELTISSTHTLSLASHPRPQSERRHRGEIDETEPMVRQKKRLFMASPRGFFFLGPDGSENHWSLSRGFHVAPRYLGNWRKLVASAFSGGLLDLIASYQCSLTPAA